jgi:hypothetical protein
VNRKGVGLGPGPRPPWAWWGVLGACCRRPGPSEGRLKGRASSWPREAEPQGRDPLASRVVGDGGCLQPTVMPKWNEVSCVWMHGRCVCTPVLVGSREAQEPGQICAENLGQRWGGPQGPQEEGWAGPGSGMGLLAWACGMLVCFWVLCVFL